MFKAIISLLQGILKLIVPIIYLACIIIAIFCLSLLIHFIYYHYFKKMKIPKREVPLPVPKYSKKTKWIKMIFWDW